MGKKLTHINSATLAEMFAKHVRTNSDGRPDGLDCRSVSDALYADSHLAREAADMHGDVFAKAGGRGSYGVRRKASAAGIGRCLTDETSGTRTSDPAAQPGMRQIDGCDDGPRCDGDILGYSTLGAEDPTLVGPGVVGAVAVGGQITVDSGNAYRYQPHFFFWEGRDRLNDFEVTPSYLISAQIGGTQQLVGGASQANAITNSVFALTDLPLDVGWQMFGTERATQLLLQMGNYIPGTSLDFNFVWWGNSRKMNEQNG